MSEDGPRVPPVDQRADPDTKVRLHAELRDLELNNQLRGSELADRRQKRWLRGLAFALGFAIIGGLSWLLFHVSHQLAGGSLAALDPSVQLAMFITPILSGTTITIFVLIGAFRGFRDKDLERIPAVDMARELNKATNG